MFQSIMSKNNNQQGQGGGQNPNQNNNANEQINQVNETDSLATTADVFGLIGVQTVRHDGDDFLSREKREQASKKWGTTALDKLDEIKKIILSGRIPAEKLQDLATHAGSNKVLAQDPLLRDILQDIQTRALVEIAKLKRAEEMSKQRKL